MAEYRQASRRVKIQTPLGVEKLKLVRLQGTETISQPFEYVVDLISGDSSIEGSQLVGKPVSISFAATDGYTRNIHGIVSSFCYRGQCPEPVSGAGYQVKVVPWFWFLKNNKDCEIFQEMKVPQIIEKVFRDLGFNDFTMQLREQYAEREYCVQYNESDFDFVSRLMEEEGIFYFFKHSAGKHIMVLADSLSAYYDLRDSQVDVTPKGQPQTAHVFGWQHSYEFRPGKVARRDFNFKQPNDKLEAKEESRTPYSSKERFEVYEYPGRYYEGQVGSRLAKVRREEVDAEHEVIRGEGYYPSFSPGGKFTVSKHQRSADQGKSFVLTSVTTEFTSGFDFDTPSEVDFINEFTCIPAETVFRPARKTPKPLADGPQTAIVATDGDEISVDEHARVKVQFHWDRYGKKNSKSSCWIRVSQSHAGKGWGVIDIPRKDEEVIVSFLDGDPDRPIITGRVYNGDNQPPFGLSGASDNSKNKTRRGNTTKTYNGSGYNEMTMDDTPGQEEIRIHGEYDMNTTVNHDETHTIGQNRTKDIGKDETMSIGNNQSLTVGVNKTVQVGTNHSEAVGSNQSVTIGTNQTTSVGVNQTTTVGTNQSNSVGMVKNETVGMMSNEMVGAMKTTNVGAVYSIISGAAMNTAVGMISAEEVGISKTVMVGSSLKISAGSMIEITCGASKLTMDSGGKVTISGTEFLFSASGNVKINGSIIDLN